MYSKSDVEELLQIYKDGLLNDCLPFWIDNSVDRKYGGFIFSLDRDGSVVDTDKGVWQQCRFTWLLATLYNEVEKKPKWLKLAKHGIDFIDRYCFDKDGRMFFHLNREGQAIRKRRYLFSETFACIAYAAYSRASGESRYQKKAEELFSLILKYHTNPDMLENKFTNNRRLKGLAMPMILIKTAQELRKNLFDSDYSKWINRYINEIKNDYINKEYNVLLENVGAKKQLNDSFDGRLLNPGHAIEASWFIMEEGMERDNKEYLNLGIKILDWMWDVGWDKKYGGIYYYRDVLGKPVQEYWHDMKFWWPQNETIIASLLAYRATGLSKYYRMHKKIHEWTYKYFPDQKYGEWYGYLHRDGRISVRLKGNLWKGPFHIPRMQLICWQLTNSLLNDIE